MGRGSWALVLLASCNPPVDPPGRSAGAASASAELSAPTPAPVRASEPKADAAVGADAAAGAEATPKIASIAMRTWVHFDPSRHAPRIGYLRAGALVARDREPAGFDGCPGGWFHIEPRGYVCVGRGASLDTDHDVVQAAASGPLRGQPYPYHYVMSRRPPPIRYVRLPTEKEQKHVEGVGPEVGASSWALRNLALLGTADRLTPFLASGRDMPKPFGAEEKLRFAVHRGRAKGDSAFGISATFDWTGRRFGLTTELDLIPIDRTTVVEPSSMRGLVVHDPGTPAFVMVQGIGILRPDGSGALKPAGMAELRSGWVLTGKSVGVEHRLVETTEGAWLPEEALRIATVGQDLWGQARAGRKWIDVSIERQILVAYEGTRPVYATLVSTGRGGLGDPETTSATVQGTFFIFEKHVSVTMDGDEASDDAFDLRDVPYVQYFHKGFALHGAYWHDKFGTPRSHGCVNLAPADAAWLFEWTDPVVPPEWHGVINKSAGTLVYIHP